MRVVSECCIKKQNLDIQTIWPDLVRFGFLKGPRVFLKAKTIFFCLGGLYEPGEQPWKVGIGIFEI